MSKIVVAVNAMISQKNKISSVIPGNNGTEGETYFVFDGKHKWSIFPVEGDAGDFILCYYPGGMPIEYYAALGENTDWDEVGVVFYRTRELGTKEARQSFAELHSLVEEMKYGMDEILDEIISSNSPF
jgi:hypothetical protein